MEKTGVNVLCENSTRCNLGSLYYTCTGQEMRELVEYINHPLIHICWDTGHANSDKEGGQYDDIMALGEELYAIHYNDNHGKADDHVAPFLGRMNNDEVISALIDVGFSGYLTFECGSSLIGYNQWTGPRRRFEPKGDRELKLSEPQLFMQRHIEAMLHDTGKWMLESYGIFEE